MADDLLSMILQARQGAQSRLGNYGGSGGPAFTLDPSALEHLRASLGSRMGAGKMPMPADVLGKALQMDNPAADVAKARMDAAAAFMKQLRGGTSDDDELRAELGGRVGRLGR